jgi:hypothetical protein
VSTIVLAAFDDMALADGVRAVNARIARER